MIQLPLVSIVTPSFNQAEFLEESILSVVRQDYPHIQYIVIDGGSSDGSVEIIRKYEKYINYWISEPDNGQAHAINKGFMHANGSIFAWLNSDDLLTPSAVTIAAHFLSTNPLIGVVYADRLHIDKRGNIIGIRKCPGHDQRMFKRNFTLPQETVFFRKEIFDDVGGLDEHLQFSMDFDLWCKMTKVADMYHIPAFLGYYREHENAKSVNFHGISSGIEREYAEEHKIVYRRHFGTDLPRESMMKWYRLYRKLRIIYEQRTRAYLLETQKIRSIVNNGE